MNYGQLLDELFSKLVEPKLIQPTFVMDYPWETSPLAKRKRDNPDLVERFELFIPRTQSPFKRRASGICSKHPRDLTFFKM